MTNADRKQRRREAALRGAKTRAARQAQAQAVQPVPVEPEPPAAPAGRQLIERSREIGRERDLYRRAHLERIGGNASRWTVEQRQALGRYLDSFIRPDGTAEPVEPRRRRRR